jgi:hypothetical protein
MVCHPCQRMAPLHCQLPREASGELWLGSLLRVGIAPQESENNNEYLKKWADKIINFMNNLIKWKYSNNFKFRGALTKMINGKVANCLDEVLLDEDIGGFVGMFLFDTVDVIKDNSDVMKNIFGNGENLEVGDSILMANWKNWSNEED